MTACGVFRKNGKKMGIYMGTIHGKIAVVTGASRGIGRAIAKRLADDGATVVVNYVSNSDAAAEIVQEIAARGGKALALQADVGRLDDIRRLFRDTVAHFGRLDILVANAGYSVFKPFTEISEDDFDRTYALNAKGTFFCLQESLRYMADGGKIVCISTIGTELNPPGGSCYFGSKAAVEQFCRVLAKEVAPRRITVNVVSPGFTDTEMLNANLGSEALRELVTLTPLARLGQPDDIADVVAFLVSHDARWLTRQNIAVDGGIISR
jgi:3-oxoacyl-[acyl-carrier protein] reductase